MEARHFLSLLTLVLAGCEDRDAKLHEDYLEGRKKFASVYARSLNDECREEPACSEAIAVFEALPAEHVDHGDAQDLLERIRVARARREEVQQSVKASASAPPPVFHPLPGEEKTDVKVP